MSWVASVRSTISRVGDRWRAVWWIARVELLAAQGRDGQPSRARAVIDPEHVERRWSVPLREPRQLEVAISGDAGPGDRRPGLVEPGRIELRHRRAQGRIDIPSLDHERAIGGQGEPSWVVDAIEDAFVHDVVDREQDVVVGQPGRRGNRRRRDRCPGGSAGAQYEQQRRRRDQRSHGTAPHRWSGLPVRPTPVACSGSGAAGRRPCRAPCGGTPRSR